MNHPPAVQTTLSSLARGPSLSNVGLIGQAFTASQSTPKHGRKPHLSHNQFWINISKTAAAHTCRISELKKQLQAMPSEASAAREVSTSGRGEQDLLIVGPGVLGSLIGKLWLDGHEHAEVVGQTNSDTNHKRLRALGLTPRLKQDADGRLFTNVIFSAPPSGSKDYVAEVQRALASWSGKGTFIFTSSSGVMKPEAGEPLTEETALHSVGISDRTDRLLKCEQVVLEAGGCVARFVGLYHAQRGAHMFFLRQGTVERWGGRVVNLIHYEDAADFCLKILERSAQSEPFRSEVFFGTDSSPLTFQEMMERTLESGAYEGSFKFVGNPDSEPGAGSSNTLTREKLSWKPKYSSFRDFMDSGAKDVYHSLP